MAHNGSTASFYSSTYCSLDIPTGYMCIYIIYNHLLMFAYVHVCLFLFYMYMFIYTTFTYYLQVYYNFIIHVPYTCVETSLVQNFQYVLSMSVCELKVKIWSKKCCAVSSLPEISFELIT